MQNTNRAYTAGVFDGEGCISIQKRGDGYLRLRTDVVNTDLEMLEYLKEIWGGNIYKQKDKRKGRKDKWTWVLCSFSAKKFLEEIFLYLISKQKQAELGIKFQERLDGFKINEKEKKIRYNMYIKMQELK